MLTNLTGGRTASVQHARSELTKATDTDTESKLRIVTLNIRHGANAHGEIRLEALGDLLAQLAADVVCLQEVDVGTRRSSCVNQADILATRSHHLAVFSPTIEYDAGLYGLAVLVRSHPSTLVRLQLPSITASSEPRHAMAVGLIDGCGLVNVHLSRKREEAEEQAKFLVQFLPSWVTIVCGDFNLPLKNLAFDRKAWVSVFSPNEEPRTWPVDRPSECVDHILIRADEWICADARTVNFFSTDHLAIVADLRRSHKEE